MSEPSGWAAPDSGPTRPEPPPAGPPAPHQPTGPSPTAPYPPTAAYPPPSGPVPAGPYPPHPPAAPYPPPGWAPPPGASYPPPPGWGPEAGPGGWAPPPPVPRPGVIPLRPLGLSDILEGAVAYVRANPKTTLGLSAVVITITTLIQIPAQAAYLGSLTSLGVATGPSAQLDALTRLISGATTSVGVSTLVSYVSSTVLTGMLVVVLSRAVMGGRATLREAWVRLRPRLLGLFGLTLLAALILLAVLAVPTALIVGVALTGLPTGVKVLVGVLVGIAAICAMVFTAVHLSLGAPAYVLEPIGVPAALRRSFRLVRGQFWRIFGIQLLTGLIAAIIGGILAAPFSIAGGLITGTTAATGGSFTIVPSVVLSAIGTILATTLVTPFSAGVSGLLYIDQRIRREALDIELTRAAYR